jgi:hypothetical protein
MIKPIALEDTRRASKRHSFMIRAILSSGGSDDQSGRVRDLSAEGMKIEMEPAPDVPFKKGDPVTVQMRGVGQVKAEIAWRRAHWYGIRFARPIKPELVMKPVGTGVKTPDYVKPVLVPSRSLKYVQGL